jgi:hypothetical protein
MSSACTHCGDAITGMGSNNARLCFACWTDILLRVGAGETRVGLAREFGVSRQAVASKWLMYGGTYGDNETTQAV